MSSRRDDEDAIAPRRSLRAPSQGEAPEETGAGTASGTSTPTADAEPSSSEAPAGETNSEATQGAAGQRPPRARPAPERADAESRPSRGATSSDEPARNPRPRRAPSTNDQRGASAADGPSGQQPIKRSSRPEQGGARAGATGAAAGGAAGAAAGAAASLRSAAGRLGGGRFASGSGASGRSGTSSSRGSGSATTSNQTDASDRATATASSGGSPTAGTTAKGRADAPAAGKRPRGRGGKAAPAKIRKAHLRVTQIDAWSVMKTSFLLSIALGIVTVVAVGIVWSVLDAVGLWDSINSVVQQSVGSDTGSPFDVRNYLSTSRVMGFTMILAVVDVVLITALATLGAFLYNLSATLLGGIEVTLAEDR